MNILRNAALLIPQLRRLRDERNTLAARLTRCESETLSPASSPFFHYHATFDPQEVLRRHAVPYLHASPGYFTNFLGVRIDPKFFPATSSRAGRRG